MAATTGATTGGEKATHNSQPTMDLYLGTLQGKSTNQQANPWAHHPAIGDPIDVDATNPHRVRYCTVAYGVPTVRSNYLLNAAPKMVRSRQLPMLNPGTNCSARTLPVRSGTPPFSLFCFYI